MNLRDKRVCVTGGAGFLGSHVVNRLWAMGCSKVFIPRIQDYDLRQREDAVRMYHHAQPDVVIHLAALVGGIGANRALPGKFFYDNAIMGMQLMDVGQQFGIQKFVQMGSACEYPANAPIPTQETDVWSGFPEGSNAPYGIAKRALLVQGQAYRVQYGMNVIHILSTNLYGPGDNFDLGTSHVIPAIISRCVTAKETNASFITMWGTGRATRDFMFVKDAAEGIIQAAESYNESMPINLGSGNENSISYIVDRVKSIVGFHGDVVWDASKPDGQARRVLDITRARQFGFAPKTLLEQGLKETIEWYVQSR
jgi:GDP-L-fucose synthase